MGKRDLLKDSMKGGLNSLLSSTTPSYTEDKLTKVAGRKRQQYTVTSLSTRVFIPE